MKALRFGTRGSALARWQTEHVIAALCAHDPSLGIDIVEIASQGDQRLDVPLDQAEGTGLFTSALEDALLRGDIDVAVHSLKDLPTASPAELLVAAIPTRAPVEDALCSRHPGGVAGLPHGARVGTCSTRRRAQLLMLRPDVVPVPIRGNVPTRLGRVAPGDLDAVILACAGLVRLGLDAHVSEVLSVQAMLPAPGQGALAVEARRADGDVCRLLASLEHGPTRVAATVERDLLSAMGGGCAVPVGAHAVVLPSGEIALDAGVFSPDGRTSVRVRVTAGRAADAVAAAASQLFAAGARGILAACERDGSFEAGTLS